MRQQTGLHYRDIYFSFMSAFLKKKKKLFGEDKNQDADQTSKHLSAN